jgi:hypothetical protein
MAAWVAVLVRDAVSCSVSKESAAYAAPGAVRGVLWDVFTQSAASSMHACQPEIKHLAIRHPTSVSVRARARPALLSRTSHCMRLVNMSLRLQTRNHPCRVPSIHSYLLLAISTLG